MMYTNADITLYHKTAEGYEKREIKDVFWDEKRSSVRTNGGMNSSDTVKIFIPVSSAENLTVAEGSDFVIRGFSDVEIVNTSQQTQSDGFKALREAHEVFTVTVCEHNTYGSKNVQHYLLSCR